MASEGRGCDTTVRLEEGQRCLRIRSRLTILQRRGSHYDGDAIRHFFHFLRDIQRLSFEYFLNEANPENGLVTDRNTQVSPASIAAVGLALSGLGELLGYALGAGSAPLRVAEMELHRMAHVRPGDWPARP